MTWAALRARLDAWAADPASAVGDGDEPPGVAALYAARVLVDRGERVGACPPTRVVPDGEGGLAFELHGNRALWVACLRADGGIEVEEFANGVLRRREAVEPGNFRWPELRIEWSP